MTGYGRGNNNEKLFTSGRRRRGGRNTWMGCWRWGGQSRIFNCFSPNLTQILSVGFWFLLYLGQKREWLWRFSGVSAEAIYFVLTFVGRGGPWGGFWVFPVCLWGLWGPGGPHWSWLTGANLHVIHRHQRTASLWWMSWWDQQTSGELGVGDNFLLRILTTFTSILSFD